MERPERSYGQEQLHRKLLQHPGQEDVSSCQSELQLQEQVASEVIDHVYEIINTYQGKGNRWYDNDPMMLKGVELLRNAPASIQRVAALKLLVALEQKSFEGVEI